MSTPSGPVLWTHVEAALATDGASSGEWSAHGVSIDTRSLQPGDLFIALHGPNFDGHEFAAAAAASDAAAIVADQAKAADISRVAAGTPVLSVADTMTALEKFAGAARGRAHARIVAVTGSVGKTGTKEALRLALQGQGTVSATEGNLNNHWGLPLSLARLPADADFGIFEMGMNHPGEIAPLSALARPHVAVITEVVDVHAEFFASTTEIADAKAEIFTGMDGQGTAILNRDNPLFGHLQGRADDEGVGRVLSFGAHADADAHLDRCALFGDASDVTATIMGNRLDYRVAVPGRHWVLNSLAVLTAVHALGADVEAAAASLANLSAMKGRGNRHVISFDGGTFTLIDESYNASPASMRAAIGVLANDVTAGTGRRVAVLGDMLELGGKSERLHQELAESLTENAIDVVFTAGQYMSALWDALPAHMRGGHVSVANKLVPMVTAAVRNGDVVMVKGSLGSRMGQIVEALSALHHHGGRVPQAANGE